MSLPLRHHRSPGAAPGPRTQRGETLVEVLATVVLMGIGFVALLNGLFTVTRVTDINQTRTMASMTVQAWAENLQQPALPIPAVTQPNQVPQVQFTTYVACANPGSYGGPPGGAEAYLQSGQRANFTATIKSIRNVQQDAKGRAVYSGGKPQWMASVNDCYNAYGWNNPKHTTAPNGTDVAYATDGGLQEITIEIDSGSHKTGPVKDTLVIIKRDQRCPGTYDNADLGPC